MEKKLVSLLLAVALVLSLAACGPTSTTAATAAITEASAVGSYHSFYADQEPVYVPAFTLGGTTETTGAGDTFCASVLSFLLEKGITGLTRKQRKDMLRFANAAAYIVTTRKGAIRACQSGPQLRRFWPQISDFLRYLLWSI